MSETTAATRSNAVSARSGVPYPRRWLAAVVMVGAVLMDMIDITIVNVALPTIGRDLDARARSSSGWSPPTCSPSLRC